MYAKVLLVIKVLAIHFRNKPKQLLPLPEFWVSYCLHWPQGVDNPSCAAPFQ